MRDFIFKGMIGSNGYVDRTWLKKEVIGVFGERIDENGNARYLISGEPLISSIGDWFRIRVLDGVEIPATLPNFREITIPEIKSGQRIALQAWVALNQNALKSGDAPSITNERCRRKLIEIAEKHAQASMHDYRVDVSTKISVMKADSKGTKFSRAFGHIAIIGEVSDLQYINHLQQTGIGSAKAYGFGLVASQIQ